MKRLPRNPNLVFVATLLVVALAASSALAQKSPPDVPSAWKSIIGEYVLGSDTLSVLEKDGSLQLGPLNGKRLGLSGESNGTFRVAGVTGDPGSCTFTRGPNGVARSVDWGGRSYLRLQFGNEDGKSFRIKPLRSIEILRREALGAKPPVESFKPGKVELVELVRLDPSIRLDIRYATTNNFLGSRFYSQPRAFLQKPAAEALLRAHQALRRHGYGLLIHDAYRPWYVTKMFWDAAPESLKEFVADPAKGSRHNRGCAVDLSLYNLKTGRPVEMSSGYDEFSHRATPDYPGGTTLQRWHRELLRTAMEAEGFSVFHVEWWHFDYKDWNDYPIGTQRFEEIK